MASRVIETIGGLNFTGFYYPEIYTALLNYLRINKDRLGLTDENELEVHTQLLSAFAATAHMNNTRADSIATEMFIDSLQMRQSLKRLLRLMGIELKSATPAVAEILARISAATSTDQTDYVPILSEFETSDAPAITYENLTALDLDRTDQISACYYTRRVSASGGSDKASVDTNSDVVTRASGTWPTTIVGNEIYLKSTTKPSNLGFFRVVARIDTTRIRVVQVPSSTAPAFQTETDIEWELFSYSADLASTVNGAGTFAPFAATVYPNEMLYASHAQCMPNRIDMTFSASHTGGVIGVWEYHDTERSLFNPTAIYYSGSTLSFDLTSLLGTKVASYAIVTVTYTKTGASEKLISAHTHGTLGAVNYVTAAGLFGQVTPSEDVTDYLVSAEWVPFPNQNDTMINSGTDLGQDGRVTFDLPQDLERSWTMGAVNLVTGRWFRFRLVGTAGANRPTVDRIRIDQGDQYLSFSVTQGETVGPVVIGSSTGASSQVFTAEDGPYLDDTETVEVDESGAGTWTEYVRVLSFKNSLPTDRHYIRQVSDDDQLQVVFGDGTNGKIPPAGAGNVRATFRIGGEDNGSVGARQITVNASGISGIVDIVNPRPALGWRLKDAGDTIDIDRVRRSGPAQLRTRSVGTLASDIEYLAVEEFQDSSGIKLVERAVAVEEGYGIKTVKLLVVGLGGTALSNTELQSLDLFFNGDRLARPQVQGKMLVNHRLTSVNYEPAVITVEATVIWPRGSAEAIRNALSNYLNPLAVDADLTTYIWDFGSQVSLSKVYNLIHEISPNIKDIPTLKLAKGSATPSATSVSLSENELPYSTVSNIIITLLES